MNSTFTANYIKDLASLPVVPQGATGTTLQRTTPKKENLRSLISSLNQPLSHSETRETLKSLERIEDDDTTLSVTAADSEEDALKRAIIEKIVVGLYAEALDTYLAEASEAEAEAEWWADIERSRRNVAYYLIQTLPARLVNLAETIVQSLRTRNIPLTPSIFTPSSLRSLFPSDNSLRPNALTTALFPHLRNHSHTIPLSYYSATPSRQSSSISSAGQRAVGTMSIWTETLSTFVTLPYQLTKHECHIKRKELQKIRDERAEVLGTLTSMRDQLASALKTDGLPMAQVNGAGVDDKLASFVDTLLRSATGQLLSPPSTPSPSHRHLLVNIETLANMTLQSHIADHQSHLEVNRLNRPSRLTLLWPRLLILPPLSLYLARTAYNSRDTLVEMANDAGETIHNFFRDWLLQPIKDVINTIRAGGEDGVIVRKEGVAADMASLERMTLSLAREKLNYTQEQLTSLSKQIRVGDLTPILQIYEEDIKSPLKSAITGTLLRSVFVQVQKAKVDIDQALAGIDKLLKSQELTFAFVGVAPAFAIVYFVGGHLKRLWSGGSGRGRYGGRNRRAGVWLAMRRIERLLIFQPKSTHRTLQSTSSIPPLTSGLLLLSVTQLRRYAETSLSTRSGLREGFLEDVQDLEDPSLDRTEKLRVVDRMWRNWGELLGWSRVGDGKD